MPPDATDMATCFINPFKRFRLFSGRQSKKKDAVQLAARFAVSLLKKIPECIDVNPVKVTMSIVKVIIDISETVGDNNSALVQALRETEGVIETVAAHASEATRDEIEPFRLQIESEKESLLEISRSAKAEQYLDFDKFKNDIESIVNRMKASVEQLKFAVSLRIAKAAENIQQDLRNAALDKLLPAVQADYRTIQDYGKGLKRETCTEGTRVTVLENITTWVKARRSKVPTVYWLTGQAGSGKTTIAHTIATHFANDSGPDDSELITLGANFFCSQQFAETRKLTRVIPTIAHQLAHKSFQYATALYDANKFDAVNHSLSRQIRELLVEPWHNAHTTNPPSYLIVIDALDELNDDGGTELLRDLLTTVEKSGLKLHGLKFLITSRTNPEIGKLFEALPQDAIYRLQDTPMKEANDDIARYLEVNLPKIARSEESQLLSELQARAQGLFIYAATVVKFVNPRIVMTAREQIQMLKKFLSGAVVVKDATLAIDALYQQLMSNVFSGLSEETLSGRLHILYTFLCAAERIPASLAAAMTPGESIDDELAQCVLDDLHAVLYATEDGRVLWYHSSFPDFLFDQRRSNYRLQNEDFEFWCDASTHHALLGVECFSIMKMQLRFNICDIASSFQLDEEHLSKGMVDRCISPALAYSSRHWAHHLPADEPQSTVSIAGLTSCISDFLQIQVLFWIEAMNLLKSSDKCPLILQRAREWILKHGINNSGSLVSGLLEAENFATYFTASPVTESTPHLYISSLATWPESDLSRTWKQHFLRLPAFIHRGGKTSVSLVTITTDETAFCVRFSSDGAKIAYSDGPFVEVADATTGTPLLTLEGHTGIIPAVAFSSDGTLIASGASDWSIRLWNATTGIHLYTLEGHTNGIDCIAFSKDGTRIASGSKDRSVRIWDTTTRRLIYNMTEHTETICSVAYSTDGKWIVSGSDDKSARVWDTATGKQIRILEGHTHHVDAVAISNDDMLIATSSEDKSVKVWDATTGEHLRTMIGHTDLVSAVSFSNDGSRIVSGSFDGTIRIWDTKTCIHLSTLEGHTGLITSLAISNNGTRIASGSADASVRVWDATTDILQEHLEGHTNFVTSVTFSSDGAQIVSGSWDTSVRVWDAKTGRQQMNLEGHTKFVSSVVISADRTRIASGSFDHSLCVWDATSGLQLFRLNGHSDAVMSVAFSQDGTRIISGSKDRSVQVWDAKTGEHLKTFEGHAKYVNSVTFSREGTLIASGSSDGSVKIWDLASGTQLKDLEGHRDYVSSVVFSPNVEMRIASGSADGTVLLWDVLTGTKLFCLEGHTNIVTSVSFSNDGTRIASGSWDKSVRIWDVSTGAQLNILEGHTGIVTSIAFSYDATRIVYGTGGGSVQVWNTSSDPQWTWTADNWIVSMPEKRQLMWAPDEIRILDQSTVEPMISRHGHTSFIIDHYTLGDSWNSCYTRSVL